MMMMMTVAVAVAEKGEEGEEGQKSLAAIEKELQMQALLHESIPSSAPL